MSIGELAASVGATARTLRHYHAVGLLPVAARRVPRVRQHRPGAAGAGPSVGGSGSVAGGGGAALGPDECQDLREVHMIISFYARGLSTRDITARLAEACGHVLRISCVRLV